MVSSITTLPSHYQLSMLSPRRNGFSRNSAHRYAGSVFNLANNISPLKRTDKSLLPKLSRGTKALPPITNVKLGPFLPKVTKGYSANPAKVLFDTEEDL